MSYILPLSWTHISFAFAWILAGFLSGILVKLFLLKHALMAELQVATDSVRLKGKRQNHKLYNLSIHDQCDTACRHDQMQETVQDHTEVHIQSSLNAALENFCDRLLQEYVASWHDTLGVSPELRLHLRYALRIFVLNAVQRLQQMEFSQLLSEKGFHAICNHFEHFRTVWQRVSNLQTNPGSGYERPHNLEQQLMDGLARHLHVAMRSRESELVYLRSVTAMLLPTFLHHSCVSSPCVLHFLQEVIASNVLLPAMDALANPDNVNHILILCFGDSTNGKTNGSTAASSEKVQLMARYLHTWVLHMETRFSEVRAECRVTHLQKDQLYLYDFMKYLSSVHCVEPLTTYLSMNSIMTQLMQPATLVDGESAFRSVQLELQALSQLWRAESTLSKEQQLLLPLLHSMSHGPPADVMQLVQNRKWLRYFEQVVQTLEQIYLPMYRLSHIHQARHLGETMPTPEVDALLASATCNSERPQATFLSSLIFNSLAGFQAPFTASFHWLSNVYMSAWQGGGRQEMAAIASGEEEEEFLLIESNDMLDLLMTASPQSPPPQNSVTPFLDAVQQARMSPPETHSGIRTRSTSQSNSIQIRGGPQMSSLGTVPPFRTLDRSFSINPRSREVSTAIEASESLLSTFGILLPPIPETKPLPSSSKTPKIPLASRSVQLPFESNTFDLSTFRVSIPALTQSYVPNSTSRDRPEEFAYVVSVCRVDHEHMKVRVTRRYHEFYVLEQKLTEFHGTMGEMLPIRRQFVQRNLKFLDDMRDTFERYLQFLLTRSFLKHSQLLYLFLTSSTAFQGSSSLPDLKQGFHRLMPKLSTEKGQRLEVFLLNFLQSCAIPNSTTASYANSSVTVVPFETSFSASSSAPQRPNHIPKSPGAPTASRRTPPPSQLDNILHQPLFWNNGGLSARKSLSELSPNAFQLHPTVDGARTVHERSDLSTCGTKTRRIRGVLDLIMFLVDYLANLRRPSSTPATLDRKNDHNFKAIIMTWFSRPFTDCGSPGRLILAFLETCRGLLTSRCESLFRFWFGRLLQRQLWHCDVAATAVNALHDAIFEPAHGPPSSERERSTRREQAWCAFRSAWPTAVDLALGWGGDAEEQEMRYRLMFECLQCPKWNKQLTYIIVDMLLMQLFPNHLLTTASSSGHDHNLITGTKKDL